MVGLKDMHVVGEDILRSLRMMLGMSLSERLPLDGVAAGFLKQCDVGVRDAVRAVIRVHARQETVDCSGDANYFSSSLGLTEHITKEESRHSC